MENSRHSFKNHFRISYEERNKKIIQLMERAGFKNVYLHGKPENPIIVMDENYRIPVWSNNWVLKVYNIFDKEENPDRPEGETSELLIKVDLRYMSDIDYEEFGRIIHNDIEWFPIYKIILDVKSGDSEIFLTSWVEDHFGDKQPTFSTAKPRIYFKPSDAEQTIERLNKRGIPVSLYEPD
jgi:hypothetical protein